jgi:hypothetical protein
MPSYDEKRRKLMEIIQENAIVFQDVQLFSKVKSQYYYDIKRISLQISRWNGDGCSCAGNGRGI